MILIGYITAAVADQLTYVSTRLSTNGVGGNSSTNVRRSFFDQDQSVGGTADGRTATGRTQIIGGDTVSNAGTTEVGGTTIASGSTARTGGFTTYLEIDGDSESGAGA